MYMYTWKVCRFIKLNLLIFAICSIELRYFHLIIKYICNYANSKNYRLYNGLLIDISATKKYKPDNTKFIYFISNRTCLVIFQCENDRNRIYNIICPYVFTRIKLFNWK